MDPKTLCPGDDELRAFLVGGVPEAAGQAVADHLTACAACQKRVTRLDEETDPLLRSLRRALRDRSPEADPTPRSADTPRPQPPEMAGRTVAGYEILGELGRGGMSVVYKARQRVPARLVALKMILGGEHAGADRRARFLVEADAIARLRHPNIVGIYEVGFDADVPFFSLELVEGETLHDRLARTPQPPAFAASLVETLARAARYAHERGIIHRDLKPGNVLLSADGTPKLADFGLARLQQVAGEAATPPPGGLTGSNAVLGTPSYMAPEQAAGTSSSVGPAADTYALGAILYEALTGRPPFQAATPMETVLDVLTTEPIAPRRLVSGVPRDLETICLKCLHKDPQRRYPSADALADDLGRWLEGKPILARPAGPIERAVKWARRRPIASLSLAGAVTGVLMLVALALFASYQWNSASLALLKADEEKKRRAVAQIDNLRDANPGAVPLVLAALEQSRDEALPHLRERHAQEADPAKKARLALALLPVEPEVRGEIVRRMLTDEDPAEVVLLRDTLKPHADAELVGRLWHLADDVKAPESERFRALAALAAFDEKAGRWERIAADVAQRLLKTNPLQLGKWVEAMEPVSGELSGPLARIFRDETPSNSSHREAAAHALKLYLTRRPEAETLFGLLLDADGKQFALLRPLLLGQDRGKVIARMNAELAKVPDYWKDAPSEAWKSDAKAEADVVAAGGILAERWAMCQALPLERLQAVTEAMGAAGYRPVSVRPWAPLAVSPPKPTEAKPRAARVAIVWVRDGREWKLEVGLSLAELKRQDAAWQKAGLIPADVACYAAADGQRNYLGVWRRGDKGEAATFFAGVTQAEAGPAINALRAGGYVPARVQSITDATGGVRFCGVWVKARAEDWNLLWETDEGTFAGHVADDDRLLIDAEVGPMPRRPWRKSWEAAHSQRLAEAMRRPRDASPHLFVGIALYNLGRDAEAMKAFETFHDMSKSLWGHRYQALLHARAGKAAQARDALSAFSKVIGENRAVVASTTAMIGIYLGEADEALGVLERQIRANREQPGLLYEAACAYSCAADVARRRQQAAWGASLVGSPTLSLVPPSARADGGEKFALRSLALLKQAIAAGYADLWNVQTVAELEAIRELPGYADLLRRLGLTRRYGSVWRGDSTRQNEALQGMTADAHLAKCRGLAAKGYRPVALSLARLADEPAPLAASVWHRPIDVPERETVARRQANAAAMLLLMKSTETVWPLFRHSPDPTARSYLVWRAGELGSDPGQIIARLDVETDLSARRALILALGEYGGKELPAAARVPVVKKLLAWYRDDPDPGTHAAIGWLLRHGNEGATPRRLDWGQAKALGEIDRELRGKQSRKAREPMTDTPDRGAGWYVTGQGQTMVMIKGPVEFRMGSPRWEQERIALNERSHMRRIGRSYALSATVVTREQYLLFLKDRPDVPSDYLEQWSPDKEGPNVDVSWYTAAAYCNWLSEKEGIPEDQWCYPRKIASGMTPYPDYLQRTGYRLPTEAEMEYACKAGSQASRYFGSSLELLPRYANTMANSQGRAWRVGQKRPNDLGLCDAHGNAWVWTGIRESGYPRRRSAVPAPDPADVAVVTDSTMQAMRGGSFESRESLVRTSTRFFVRSVERAGNCGVRVCRTLPSDTFPRRAKGRPD